MRYWRYLIHIPIVMALQVGVSALDWPWPVKFATILVIAFALIFAGYQPLVRHNFIGAALNGGRVPRTESSRSGGRFGRDAMQPSVSPEEELLAQKSHV
jgi:hypothetical protein